MEQEKIRFWNIFKRSLIFIGTLVMLFYIAKFAVIFMPFFIALILAIITEPIIKFNMNKLKMSRRMSSFIVVSITIILILAVSIWLGTFATSKIIEYSKDLPSLIGNASTTIQKSLDSASKDLSDYVPAETLSAIQESILNLVKNFANYVTDIASKAIGIVMSLPGFIVSVIVMILAFVFFTKDRVYMIDMLEYHFPEAWVKKAYMVKKEVFTTLGSYIKIYSKIIVITTVELIIAFSILNLIGFNLEHIIKLSIFIAVVDILPILGIGTILIPWSVWSFITCNIGLRNSIVSYIYCYDCYKTDYRAKACK